MLAELIPYTENLDESDELNWTSLALELIESAPDPVEVLEGFERRFFSGVSSGPFSARFVRRRPMVQALISHEDVRVRRWARQASKQLEESIGRWDERDRNQESRFE